MTLQTLLLSTNIAPLNKHCSSQQTLLLSTNIAPLNKHCSSQQTLLLSTNIAPLNKHCSSQIHQPFYIQSSSQYCHTIDRLPPNTASDFQVPTMFFLGYIYIYDSLYRRFPIPPFFRQSQERGMGGGGGRLYLQHKTISL